MKYRDVELLSAYLDGQLSPSDSAQIESRIKTDPEFAAVMDDLRVARGLLRTLPSRRAPRNFTLTPRMAGLKGPTPRVYPILRFASVFAALLFFMSYATSLASPRLAVMSAPAYGYGMGGGGGGDGEPLTMEALAPPAAEKQSTATEVPFAAQDNTRIMETPTPAGGGLEGPANGAMPAVQNEAPQVILWRIVLGASAIALGLIAWLIRVMAERSFRKKMKG